LYTISRWLWKVEKRLPPGLVWVGVSVRAGSVEHWPSLFGRSTVEKRSTLFMAKAIGEPVGCPRASLDIHPDII
jgi:hypothetical protein